MIRSRLLQGSVGEEERNLSLHNALVTAKIVRIDYPGEWPDAIQAIMDTMRTSKDGNPNHLAGALLVMLRVIKELGTARMRKYQTALQAVTPELVQLLGEIYTEKTAYWQQYFTSGQGDEDDADYAMQNSLTALKSLRRLVTVGYESPHTDAMVQGLWSLSQNQFDQFLTGVGHNSWIPVPFQDLVGKHLIQFTKLHIDMSETKPTSFALLPNSVPLARAYWGLVKEFSDVFEKSGGIKETSGGTDGGNPKHEGPLSEKLALKGLLLLRSCVSIAYRPLQTFRYKSPEAKVQEEAAIGVIKNELFTKQLLGDMVLVTISKLFIFRKSDLEAWEEDPETWESQARDEGHAWEWAIRPCAERFLVDLLTYYKELANPLLTYCKLATKVDMDIVTKEAAYCALGRAAALLHEAFDFDSFIQTALVKDAQIQDSMAKLLRRRISILLSQWISIKASKASRLVVYDIFRHLLNPEDKYNDEVVRITAARQFKQIVDDFEFINTDFLPYAADILNRLINLVQEVDNEETKLAILATIRVIVERMETHISAFGDPIMTVLPQLWESVGEEEYMMKQGILSIMTTLIRSMRADSQRYQTTMIPSLREAMNPDSALHLHLIEESVELWAALLAHSPTPLLPELTDMVQLALPLLEYDSSISTQCLEITRDYILLAPREILSDALRRPTMEALGKTVSLKSREHNNLGLEALEILVRVADEIGGIQGLTVVVQDMVELGIMRTILEGLHGLAEERNTTGPNRREGKISPLQAGNYFSFLSRIAIADPGVFINMLATVGGALEPTWQWFSETWFAHFDSECAVDRQKALCLALTRLCELPSPMQELVLARLQDYLSMWTSVVTELRPSADDDKPGRVDALVWDADDDARNGTEWDTSVDVYRREFAYRDPVHNIVAYDYILVRLGDLVRRAGGEQAFQENWAVNVDKEVLDGFQRLSQPPQPMDN